MRIRSGIIKITLLVSGVLIASAVGVISYLGNYGANRAAVNSELMFEVIQGEFISSVIESGDVESSSNVEIRCDVKSKGTAGTAILKIVDEGTQVEMGDFLCQLDDSVLKDLLTSQKIVVAEDRADEIQAVSDLDTAKRILEEYEQGTYEQQVNSLLANIAAAKELLRRASEFRRHSELLNRKGYRTKTQLEADQFAESKAQIDLKLAEQFKTVYVQHTKGRMIAEYKAEIRKQEANVEATKFTMELSVNRQQEIEDEIEHCRITAPVDGMVVHANETDRRGDASFVIEEGALMRDGQPIVWLPDPSRMQVRTKVNDSKINQIAVGQECLIRVDTDPENPVQGVVTKVSSFPRPRRYYQAPIEYEVFVKVTEQSPLIRSGLRAKVEMFVERLQEKVQMPLSSLVKNEGVYYVFVKSNGRIEARAVEIGSNNGSFIIVNKGLEKGDFVVIDADNFKEDFEFPKSLSTP